MICTVCYIFDLSNSAHYWTIMPLVMMMLPDNFPVPWPRFCSDLKVPIHIYPYISIYVCVYVYISACIYAFMYICIDISAYFLFIFYNSLGEYGMTLVVMILSDNVPVLWPGFCSTLKVWGGVPAHWCCRCRANLAHTRQSRPDSGIVFQVKVLQNGPSCSLFGWKR